MYAGRIVEEAPIDALFDRPAHPYTKGLLAAAPSLLGPRQRLAAIPGNVPNPGELPPGCAFAPRCPLAGPDCTAGIPPMLTVAPEHRAACLRITKDSVIA
jgi:peptide/nickel transport system ATP-binding protein